MKNLSAVISLIANFTTIGMFGVALVALHTWRKEFIGTKKIELARQIMESVYDVQDALLYARLNIYNHREIKEVENWVNAERVRDPQHMGVYPDRFHFWIPHHRLEERQDKIDVFNSLANKACLYWDKEIFKLFYELGECTLQVRTAAKDLYYNESNKNHSDLTKIIYSTGTDDQITKRINDIVEEFKLNLEPLYQDKQMPWKKLKKN